MIHSASATIAPDTARASYGTVAVPLSPGTLSRVLLGFPAGCHGLVGVRLRRAGQLIVPLTPGEWIASDNFTPDIMLDVKLDDVPYAVEIEYYNEDTANAHTITFTFIVSGVEGVIETVQVSVSSLPDSVIEQLQVLSVLRETMTQAFDYWEVVAIPQVTALLAAIDAKLTKPVAAMSLEELAQG